MLFQNSLKQKQIINILLCKTCVLIIYILLFITNNYSLYDLNSIFKNNTILQKTQNLKGFDEKMLINLISKINSANWLKKMGKMLFKIIRGKFFLEIYANKAKKQKNVNNIF